VAASDPRAAYLQLRRDLALRSRCGTSAGAGATDARSWRRRPLRSRSNSPFWLAGTTSPIRSARPASRPPRSRPCGRPERSTLPKAAPPAAAGLLPPAAASSPGAGRGVEDQGSSPEMIIENPHPAGTAAESPRSPGGERERPGQVPGSGVPATTEQVPSPPVAARSPSTCSHRRNTWNSTPWFVGDGRCRPSLDIWAATARRSAPTSEAAVPVSVTGQARTRSRPMRNTWRHGCARTRTGGPAPSTTRFARSATRAATSPSPARSGSAA
jgi:hypothetical protein